MMRDLCHLADPSAPLFSADRFVPRGDCGHWFEPLAWLYRFANDLTSAAYVAIFVVLAHAAIHDRRHGNDRSALPTRERVKSRVVYSVFFLLCAIGHLEGRLSFSWPSYHVFALVYALQALAAWCAVAVTIRHRFRIVAGV